MAINYVKHDEEFHGVFKLVSGEEVLAKAVMSTEENCDESLFMYFAKTLNLNLNIMRADREYKKPIQPPILL